MSPGQQLLQAPQLPLLLLTVLLLLLLQRSDLGFIAADGVWRGRKGSGEGGSARWPSLGVRRGCSITAARCEAIHRSDGDCGLCGQTAPGHEPLRRGPLPQNGDIYEYPAGLSNEMTPGRCSALLPVHNKC